MALKTISEQRCFGGVQGIYRHMSSACAGAMRFSVYQPPQAAHAKVPVLYFLAGLTCSEETFMIKAGAQRLAAELGLLLIAPDTSPRNTGTAGESDDWEFGAGAGFYLDATQAPWSAHFRMHDYVVNELPALIAANFAADTTRAGIFGHSMGGHGALTIALKHPGRYRSVSAFAPIVAPSQVPWGVKALPRFLGEDRSTWTAYDTCSLLDSGHRFGAALLVDQGEADKFLASQLQPERLEAACTAAGQPLILRRQPGYDHSYWFIQSFIGDHLRHHATALQHDRR
jgi:S-formylglutathione hydrolase